MTPAPVKLYLYDLSNGLARQLSQQFIGRQIDGIWHTSIVVFGQEIFYGGQGIRATIPGMSPYGTPLQVIDMGETALDQETFKEYLSEIREHYTGDKYHLLEFNCNSFTNDGIGFLTGGSIPAFIQDLPADFLSSPLGALLRPTIDSMFRRPAPSSETPLSQESPNQQLTPIISPPVISANPTPPSPVGSPRETSIIPSPVHICTHTSSLRSLLTTRRAVVAFFTSTACGPCQMVQPVFEELAQEKKGDDIVFAKIDMGVAPGGAIAGEWSVRITPTFLFFLDGKLVHELKGTNTRELRTQVDLLLYQLYPPHPHVSISTPVIESISTRPILFTHVPALDTVLAKLISFIDAAPDSSRSCMEAKETLAGVIVPFLKTQFPKEIQTPLPSPIPATPALLGSWARITSILSNVLSVSSLFPLVDMWRLAVLDSQVAVFLSNTTNTPDPFSILIGKATTVVLNPSQNTHTYMLTLLRFLANGFSCSSLARRIVGEARDSVTALLIPALLCDNSSVRMAAASLTFNVAVCVRNGRLDKALKRDGQGDSDKQGDWEIELVTALIEAIARENENEDTIHRLTASLAFLLHMSPFYDAQLRPLLDVLQGRAVLRGKLGEAGNIRKGEVRSLVEEVAGKLCP